MNAFVAMQVWIAFALAAAGGYILNDLWDNFNRNWHIIAGLTVVKKALMLLLTVGALAVVSTLGIAAYLVLQAKG